MKIKTCFFSLNTGHFSQILNVSLYQHNAGHMTKMTAMPIHGKTLKILLSMNQWAAFDETLHEASAT